MSGFIERFIRRKKKLPDESRAWQEQTEPLWQEASADKRVYAVRKPCLYGCGWWTMAVSDPSEIDVANLQITADFSRHVFHDCPDAPVEAKEMIGGPVPRPSH